MKLQTQIPFKKQQRNLIDYNSDILLLGSCFSNNIGKKLNYYKFKNFQNPFGILFHPKAIENLILNSINKKAYTINDIFNLNERWHCFDCHSDLSSTDEDSLLKQLNNAIAETENAIENSSHIIITLGTAWVYRYIVEDKIVASCHKVPQKKFLKELLSIDEITESLLATVELIKSVNPNTSILFTVSPVRHLKDGFIENTQSKSHLITAIHQVVDRRKNTYYFPSYEIQMDELRDYRFYAEDMIHPNKTAINYIWEKFIQTWFSDEVSNTMTEIDTVQKGLLHKPFNPNSKEHQKFLEKIELKKEVLKSQFSFITF